MATCVHCFHRSLTRCTNMLSISVDPIDFKGIDSIFAAMEASIPVRDVLDEAGAALLNRNRNRFLGERDPDNVAWLPSKAGLKRRSKGGTGTGFDTGKLYHSIQLNATGPNDREISSAVPYDKYFHKGPPMRAFLGFNDDDMTLFVNIVLKRLSQTTLTKG